MCEKVTEPPSAGGKRHDFTLDLMQFPTPELPVVLDVTEIDVTRPAEPILKRIPTFPLRLPLVFRAFS